MAEHRAQGGQLVQARRHALGDQEEQRAQQRETHVARCRGQHRHRGEVAEQGQHRVAPVELVGASRDRYRPAPPRRRLHVVDHGVGDHPDPVAGRMHPPAEVDILTEQRHAGVKAADVIPDIAADQHARAADRERVAVPVVLALVHLARLDPGDAPARGVDGDAGLEHHLPVGPVLDLGAEHRSGPRLGGAPEQLLQRVGRWLAVIVQQPHPFHPLPARHAGRARNVARSPHGAAGPGRRPWRSRCCAPCRTRPPGRAGLTAPIRCGPGCRCLPPPPAATGLVCSSSAVDDAWQPRGAVVRDDHRRDDVLRVRIVRRQVGSACCSEGHLQAAVRACCPVTQGGGTREQYAKGGYQDGQTPGLARSRLSSAGSGRIRPTGLSRLPPGQAG